MNDRDWESAGEAGDEGGGWDWWGERRPLISLYSLCCTSSCGWLLGGEVADACTAGMLWDSAEEDDAERGDEEEEEKGVGECAWLGDGIDSDGTEYFISFASMISFSSCTRSCFCLISVRCEAAEKEGREEEEEQEEEAEDEEMTGADWAEEDDDDADADRGAAWEGADEDDEDDEEKCMRDGG